MQARTFLEQLNALRDELLKEVKGRQKILNGREQNKGASPVSKQLTNITTLLEKPITDDSASFKTYLEALSGYAKDIDFLSTNKPEELAKDKDLKPKEAAKVKVNKYKQLTKVKTTTKVKQDAKVEQDAKVDKDKQTTKVKKPREEICATYRVFEDHMKKVQGIIDLKKQEEEQKREDEDKKRKLEEELRTQKEEAEDRKRKEQEEDKKRKQQEKEDIKRKLETALPELRTKEENRQKKEEQKPEEEEKKRKLEEELRTQKEEEDRKRKQQEQELLRKQEESKRNEFTTFKILYAFQYKIETFSNPFSKMKKRLFGTKTKQEEKITNMDQVETYVNKERKNDNTRSQKVLGQMNDAAAALANKTTKNEKDDAVELKRFVAAYKLKYKNTFFTNSGSAMLKMIDNKEKPLTMQIVQEHAAKNKSSRTAKVLAELQEVENKIRPKSA